MARGWPADPRRAGEPQEVGRDGALWVAGAETETPEGFIRLHLAKGTLWAWWDSESWEASLAEAAGAGGPGGGGGGRQEWKCFQWLESVGVFLSH